MHYTTKRRFHTSFRDLFFMIAAGTAFLSLFLAILLPGKCGGRDAGEFYAVCSGSYTTLERAEERADAMQKAGGGGFIRRDGMFRVLSAVYTERADCESVLGGLGSGHSLLVLRVSSHAGDVARVTRELADIYYGLDTRRIGTQEALERLGDFLGRETFPDSEAGAPGRQVFDALAGLDGTDLSVRLKYFQTAFVCAFAEGGTD